MVKRKIRNTYNKAKCTQELLYAVTITEWSRNINYNVKRIYTNLCLTTQMRSQQTKGRKGREKYNNMVKKNLNYTETETIGTNQQ
jgi:hypothetical protein